MQQNLTSQERASRLIETLKAEAEADLRASSSEPGARPANPAYRYPRSRWSAPSAQ